MLSPIQLRFNQFHANELLITTGQKWLPYRTFNAFNPKVVDLVNLFKNTRLRCCFHHQFSHEVNLNASFQNTQNLLLLIYIIPSNLPEILDNHRGKMITTISSIGQQNHCIHAHIHIQTET